MGTKQLGYASAKSTIAPVNPDHARDACLACELIMRKVPLARENVSCLGTRSAKLEEHFSGEAYRVVSGAVGHR
jgi:hypothetical protein